MIYDYAVIGAGPAGSFMAYLLQQNGYKSILLERRIAIDEKTCGGFLPNQGRMLLENAGIRIQELLQQDCAIIRRTIQVHAGSEKKYHCSEGYYGLGIRRQLLDSFLLQQARNSGADVRMNCTVQSVLHSGQIIEAAGVQARNIIWAIGARGITHLTDYKHDVNIQKALEKQTIGISEIIRGRTVSPQLSPDTIRFWYDDDRHGYFWVIPIGKNLWNIGYWTNQKNNTLMERFRLQKAQYVFPFLNEVETVRNPRGAFCGNSNIAAFLSGNGCGDVGGFNHWETGEGITPAFMSCAALMEKINEFEKNPLPRKFEGYYGNAHMYHR